jgi:hypothetical protein
MTLPLASFHNSSRRTIDLRLIQNNLPVPSWISSIWTFVMVFRISSWVANRSVSFSPNPSMGIKAATSFWRGCHSGRWTLVFHTQLDSPRSSKIQTQSGRIFADGSQILRNLHFSSSKWCTGEAIISRAIRRLFEWRGNFGEDHRVSIKK